MKGWIGRNGYWDIVLTGRHGVEHIKAIQTGSGHQSYHNFIQEAQYQKKWTMKKRMKEQRKNLKKKMNKIEETMDRFGEGEHATLQDN